MRTISVVGVHAAGETRFARHASGREERRGA
jgi:hypothetical protein